MSLWWQFQDMRSSEEHFSLFTSPFPAVTEKAAIHINDGNFKLR